jgi:hypothetical protein
MAGERRSLLGAFLETGARVAAAAAEQVLSDPRGQEALARAVGVAQRAKQRVEELQARALRAAGIPGREDLQDLARQLARIKRKARELAERVEAGVARGPAGAGGSTAADEAGEGTGDGAPGGEEPAGEGRSR